MTKTELLQLIDNGKNSGVELKRDNIENRTLAKELVAFANLAGGRVLLGVEDNGSISGITRPDLEDWVMTACRDKIRPEIIPYFETVRGEVACRSAAPRTTQSPGWLWSCGGGEWWIWRRCHRFFGGGE